MHVLLVEPSYYTRYPPLGLLKLAALHKAKGDTVEFARGIATLRHVRRNPARVYVTSLWTWAWESVHAAVAMSRVCFPTAEVWLGGIYASLTPEHAKAAGADHIVTGLISAAENQLPDHPLVPQWNATRAASLLFSHRGCVRSCGFCAVPRLEGKPFLARATRSIKHLIYPGHRRVVLWDNNILGEPHWPDVVAELKELNLEVDFNQGLDARLIDEKVATTLSGIVMPTVRIAYDFRGLARHVRRAIDLLTRAGFDRRHICSYVLFNYKDTPADLFDRVRDLLDWGVTAYPMRYQPLSGPCAFQKDSYVCTSWT